MNRYDKIVRNIGILILILMIGSSWVLGNNNVEESTSGNAEGSKIFEGIPLQRSTAAESGSLSVDETYTLSISEETGQIIKNFTARLSWSDENDPPGRPRVRRYENQPDTFSLRVMAPDGNSSDDQGQNTIGGTGDLEITRSFEDEYLSQLMEDGIAGNGNWTIDVTLTSSGIWTPVLGPGVLGLSDGVNDYSLSIEFEYYDLGSEQEAE
jgi:hypothetical protein